MGVSSLLESPSSLLTLFLLCVFIVLVAVFICVRFVRGYQSNEQDHNEQLKNLELQFHEASMHQQHQAEKNESLKLELSEYKTLNEKLNTSLHQAERSRDVALSEAQQSGRSIQEKRQQLEALQAKYDEKTDHFNTLNTSFTQLKTELEERQNSHLKQLSQFEEQKKALSEQFKVLANDILDTKTKALQETNQNSLSSVMNPFKESIESFKKEVREIHHRETTQQGELRKELDTLKELNQKITTEAHELSTALKGQKKLQGNWGELVLENVLDRSGLQLGKDYKREVSITTEEGRQRPDAIVYLPQNKHLIIDAKVSLNAYTRYINSEDDVVRKQALAEHVAVMGQRISELADRDYYKLPGLNSPEIVFMFVPIESAFVEALKADETLFQKAIENNVLVATPTTLLTSLNIVRQLWRYEDQNKHTVALATKAETVFKKLNAFLASFENIKKSLDKANEAYVKAEGQLISGKGNLVKQVGEFKNLAPAIKAELPSYFTEKAELEIDYIAAEKINNVEESNMSPESEETED
ncbi:MAG: DNA recombination protein RmuC [Oleiphilaceae bacterium]|jgi:DNA recombination protein RmuC